MKQLLLTLLFCCILSEAFAIVGIGVKYGRSSSDAGITGFNVDWEPGDGRFYGFELIVEKDAEIDALGINIGFNKYKYVIGGERLSYWNYIEEDKDIFSVPISIYYKYKLSQMFNIYGGLGATAAVFDMHHVMHNRLKVFPHLLLGTEFKFMRHWALALDAQYNFNAKAEKQGEYANLSGISGNLSARFYF